MKSVIFDFDYTLVDSSAGQIECARYALHKMNLVVPGADIVLRTIGPSFRECFRILTGEDDVARAAIELKRSPCCRHFRLTRPAGFD